MPRVGKKQRKQRMTICCSLFSFSGSVKSALGLIGYGLHI